MADPVSSAVLDRLVSPLAIAQMVRRGLVAIESVEPSWHSLVEWLRAKPVDRVIVVSDERGLEPIRHQLRIAAEHRRRLCDRDRERINRATAERTIAEADRELTALHATAAVSPGFFARLFGRSGPTAIVRERIADWQTKRTAAVAELHRIHSRFSQDELDETAMASEESIHPDDTPLPNQLTPSLDSMTDLLDRLTLRTPTELTTDDRADLGLILAADRIDPRHGDAIRRVAPSQLVIGEADDGLFASITKSLPKPAWTTEAGQIVCRIRDRGPDSTTESVIDDPAIQARFTASGDLAEIVFPADRTAAQARRWLAANLDEARPVAFGDPHWTVGDRIVASWESIAGSETVESVPGVREFVLGTTANAPTAAVEFDPDLGWTRESAEAWLMDRVALTVPAMLHVVPATVSAIPDSPALVS